MKKINIFYHFEVINFAKNLKNDTSHDSYCMKFGTFIEQQELCRMVSSSFPLDIAFKVNTKVKLMVII